jgi:catechol-2,3-dioxygenase
MAGIRRLNHAVLFVSDLGPALEFYIDTLGFRLVSREERMNAAFLRAADSANHHDLGLFGLGPETPRPSRGHTGLYHLAWQVDTLDQLAEMREALVAAGAITGESSHGATLSLYGADPDGNQFEVMWMLPRRDWGEYETAAVVESLNLTDELERWSGVGTADELGAIGSTPQ